MKAKLVREGLFSKIFGKSKEKLSTKVEQPPINVEKTVENKKEEEFKEKLENALYDLFTIKLARIKSIDKIMEILDTDYNIDFYDYDEMEANDLVEYTMMDLDIEEDDKGYWHSEDATIGMSDKEKQETADKLQKAADALKKFNAAGGKFHVHGTLTTYDHKTKQKRTKEF